MDDFPWAKWGDMYYNPNIMYLSLKDNEHLKMKNFQFLKPDISNPFTLELSHQQDVSLYGNFIIPAQ